MNHSSYVRRFWPLRLLVACGALVCATAHADSALHSLWELHGKHNTVYLLGSVHILRESDYPLPPPVMDAYAHSSAVVMEINLAEAGTEQVQADMLASATLPDDKSLPGIMGKARYARAAGLAHDLGVELSLFDQYAPWFAAEAISQLQLMQLGYQAQSGVEMFFLNRAQNDGKAISGLETVHDQIAIFENMPMDIQATYLVSSLEQAHDLAKMVDSMVRAWAHGDSAWLEAEMNTEFGRDPALYQSVLGSRNRKWLPKVEALLNENQNYLVIVGTGHLVGRESLLELLKRDGIAAVQH